MDRQVRAEGVMGEQVFHAIEVKPDRWHYSGPDWSGVLVADWQHLITMLANLIGEGKIYMLNAPAAPRPVQAIDRAGNTWLDREYLAPHQYLPRLIPHTALGALHIAGTGASPCATMCPVPCQECRREGISG